MLSNLMTWPALWAALQRVTLYSFCPPDKIAIGVVHLVLIGLVVKGFIAGEQAARRGRAGSPNLTSALGAESTNTGLALYGVPAVAATLAVDVADMFLTGWKSVLVIFDYVVLSYLFFFNNWFGNFVVLKLHQRIQKN